MAGIGRLQRLLRGLREDLAKMPAQVALTPTLLGDRERATRTGEDDEQQARAVAYGKVGAVGRPLA